MLAAAVTLLQQSKRRSAPRGRRRCSSPSAPRCRRLCRRCRRVADGRALACALLTLAAAVALLQQERRRSSRFSFSSLKFLLRPCLYPFSYPCPREEVPVSALNDPPLSLELCALLKSGLIPFGTASEFGEEERKSACNLPLFIRMPPLWNIHYHIPQRSSRYG